VSSLGAGSSRSRTQKPPWPPSRTAPVERLAPPGLAAEAWHVAVTLGWAKTYDAEYVALARILGARLLTLDARLRRGAGRLVDVIGPSEV
jgi:predicted nucleic acid-binding protein